MREVVRLRRDWESDQGRVVYRDESGQEEDGPERPWREVLAEARAAFGPGAQVMVWVYGYSRDQRYRSGYDRLTEYPVQFGARS